MKKYELFEPLENSFKTNLLLNYSSRMVAKTPGLMDSTWTSFTSELQTGSWGATIAMILLTPPVLVMCTRLSPAEKSKLSFKDAYLLAIGALAFQG